MIKNTVCVLFTLGSVVLIAGNSGLALTLAGAAYALCYSPHYDD